MRAVLAVVVLAAGFTACREGHSPFTPRPRDVLALPRQLTFGSGHDNDPRWSPGSDTVLYHTSSFNTLPRVRGVLLAISPEGGAATPVLEDVLRVGTKLLATPVLSPDGSRLAYMDLVAVETVVPCAVSGDELGVCPWSQPLLDSARLRVRSIGATQSYLLDPTISVKFAGTDPRRRAGESGPYLMRAFPFQVEHHVNYAMLFRPSWSPDGERIVYSDGLSLRIWRVGEAMSTPIPGTDDGVSPAWSPDGQWIAYTRLVRGDSAQAFCPCSGNESHVRIVYSVAVRQLTVTRPDGTQQATLGAGEDPAWSPDGNSLYVRRSTLMTAYAANPLESEIVRIARDGSSAVPIGNTSRGRSPAVSPDGRWLAFARARASAILDYDIWVVSLAP